MDLWLATNVFPPSNKADITALSVFAENFRYL